MNQTLGRIKINNEHITFPLFSSKVRAGFPSPADDYVEQPINLNHHLISNPEATFFMKVRGNSMRSAGIHDGDILLIDRSLTPRPTDIIVAIIRGELVIKRLTSFNDQHEIEVWGVVSYIIHTPRNHVRTN